ncbi:hypothetical protein M422DRAFT_273054 [Sphaerobolus stellatus SS14]|uniref:Uncharacterized protein n=1 Tax=Sphaerobolus stellatus (strain SS14) TaxID=990650 RepID=A0A0C9UA46_SPHS4|nr:hypothetical protein M422DRAFT_273054 [Sphaerobolus stellatus SS14]
MYKDFYYLDLQKMDKWWCLPDYPAQRIHFDSHDSSTGWSNIVICVWGDKAYLFTGRLIVDYFNLKKKGWGVITTRYLSPGSWPFTYFTAGRNMHIVNGKIRQGAFAFTFAKKGIFKREYYPDYENPTIEHTPIRVPKALEQAVREAIIEQEQAGRFEPT